VCIRVNPLLKIDSGFQVKRDMPITAYIGLGSNVGDKLGNCRKAIALLAERTGLVKRCSSFYRTEAVGYTDQDEFINAVVAIETEMTAQELLIACHAIESDLGRSRTVRWGPRTIDLDILLFGDQVIRTPELSVPHPPLESRAFVLVPLCEIASEMVHPVLKKTYGHLLRMLRDDHTVIKLEPADNVQ